MAGLEGTIKTPVGTVSKKTALGVGGFVVVLGAIVWYRHKQLGDTTTPTTTAEIDPATGFPYGSPEDAAALADQGAYQSPAGSGGGGGSSTVPVSNVGYTSNGQWVQAVINTMTQNGSISDAGPLSSALGKYIVGSYIAPGSNDESLVQQAIAVEGYPPVNGTSGYPPSINRTPPVGSTTPTATPSVITGLKVTGSTTSTITVSWSHTGPTPDYVTVYVNGVPKQNLYGTYTIYKFSGLKTKTAYNLQVRGFKNEIPGTPQTISARTK